MQIGSSASSSTSNHLYPSLTIFNLRMIHQPSALHELQSRFGKEEFTARQAADALSSFTLGTTFVALSFMTRAGLLSRVKKGIYAVKARESPKLALKSLGRPEIVLPKGSYATATYALSVSLSPISAPRYLDIFVGLPNYEKARAAIEAKEAFPQPRVHPFAARNLPRLEKSRDGFLVPLPEIAFVDLIKIASEKRRPISLEYEVVPFLSQLGDRWSKVRALASQEGLREYLEAVIHYTSRLAAGAGITDLELPKPVSVSHTDSSRKTMAFEGGKIDQDSIETARKTGVIVEADGRAVIGVLKSL